MKKSLLVLLGLASVACCKKEQKPEVIAHRGFWNTEGSAKNSISALRNAIELGCYGSEFDLWVTSDGVPVVFHDARTATGIEIQNATYDSLMRGAELLAGGERIPTLDEYVSVWEANDKKVKLIFEIKSHATPERDREAVMAVCEIVTARGIEPDMMEYISFSREVCKTLSQINDVAVDSGSGAVIPVAYLEGDLTPAQAREQLGATGIDYPMGVLKAHPEWIAEAHALGMTVNVWTVVSPEDMRYFADAGVDYITTDAPDVLTELLKNR
jgi:glycerophosphoryl diester phosphodiesterase